MADNTYPIITAREFEEYIKKHSAGIRDMRGIITVHLDANYPKLEFRSMSRADLELLITGGIVEKTKHFVPYYVPIDEDKRDEWYTSNDELDT